MRDDALAIAIEAPAEAPPVASAAHARRSAAGIACIVASALCFGSMPLFVRMASAAGTGTDTLLLLRFSIASAILGTVAAVRRTPLPRGRGLALLVGMGAIGYAGQALAFCLAIQLASTGLASLLLYLYPALVTVLSRVVLRHPLTPVQVGAVAAALAGSLLTIGRAGDGTVAGIAFGLSAALIYAGYILVGSRVPAGITPTASAAVVTASAAVVFGVVAVVRGVRLPATAAGWWGVAGLAFVCTVLAISLFLAGLERLGPMRASIYSTLEPPFTMLLGALFLAEDVTLVRAAGGALILGAVIVLARSDVARRDGPSPGIA